MIYHGLILQPSSFESVQEPPVDVKNWSRSEPGRGKSELKSVVKNVINPTPSSIFPELGGINHPKFHVYYWVYQTRHHSLLNF
jgi:hypothetical protein